MEWWTHLWLNEGFASWIEYLCFDHTHPEYEIWTGFLGNRYIQALSLDALANSHPIEVREDLDGVLPHAVLLSESNKYILSILTSVVMCPCI